ncbi:hypothetical protein ABN235_18990, partial [Morganella morganii]|uniref:hypothetical protein n=1 Tax=Morganella morganii TaxID=582 RepID=UPI0032DA40DC
NNYINHSDCDCKNIRTCNEYNQKKQKKKKEKEEKIRTVKKKKKATNMSHFYGEGVVLPMYIDVFTNEKQQN